MAEIGIRVLKIHRNKDSMVSVTTAGGYGILHKR